MKRIFKKVKKSTLVIIALVLLNLLTFSVLSSSIRTHFPTTENVFTPEDNNTYFKSGTDVLDWSYTLLRYFRR